MENKNKVGRPPGKPKTGGRQKGTTNVITASLRSKIEAVINDNWTKIQDDIDSLEAKDRLMFVEKLLNYAVPKLASTTSEIDIKGKLEGLSDSELDELMDSVIKKLEDGQQG